MGSYLSYFNVTPAEESGIILATNSSFIYEAFGGPMTLPMKQIAQLGIQSLVIFPYAGPGQTWTPPYDNTTVEVLRALQYADSTINITLAEVFGGESPDAQLGEEVKRDTDIKFQSVKFTLRALQIVMGGSLVVNPANSNGNEVQVLANNFLDRSPYFRLVTQSNVGSGLLQVTYPKCKISGGFTYSEKMDAWHMPEFPVKAFYDDLYLRQDGTVGATYEWFYGDGRQAGIHS